LCGEKLDEFDLEDPSKLDRVHGLEDIYKYTSDYLPLKFWHYGQ